MARILIAGCGYVGNALGELLSRDGHHVWGLRRRVEFLSKRISPIQANLSEPASLASLPDALDFVFYTAAADRSTDEGYRLAYVEGLRNLIDALRSHPQKPKRFFFTSSTAVYGQANGEWADELSVTIPNSFSGRRLLEAEHLLVSRFFPATVVRLAGIYGPVRTRLIDSVRRGEAICQEGEPTFSNRIHREDCAGLLRHLMQLDQPEHLYVGVDHEPTPQCDLLRWLAAQLGVSPPKMESAAVAASRRSGSNKRCRSNHLAASGYVFRYPTFREGYAAMLEAMNE